MSVATAKEAALPWHDPLWRQIATARRSGRIAHGLLVCGAPGVGKRRLAARFVQALLCRDPDANGDGCGACAGCRQWAAETHPDVSRLVPEEPGRQIRVDRVRAFTRSLQLTAQYETGRIGWIEPAEQLNTAAANSLLKTLEEPVPGTHLILISDRADALMATIRSRCQIVRVPPAPVAVARDWLAEQGVAVGEDADALRTPLRVVAHGERDYEALAADWRRGLTQLLAGRADAVQTAEAWARQPADLLLDWLYRVACRLIEHRLTGGEPMHDQTLARAASALDAAMLRRFCDRVTRAARLAGTNADWQLVVESLLLELTVSNRGAIR